MINTYSLWLKPTGSIYQELAKIIENLSDKYSAPIFEPHVTLIGGLTDSENNIIKKTLRLVNLVKPIKIKLTRIGYLNEYYRCIFLIAEETKSLMNMNLKAREIFGHKQDTKFLPHLSLLYGNFNSKLKEEIIRSLSDKINIEFEAESICLISTRNGPKDWYKIKRFLLE
ncbi:MAG: 2'-5' RNA ligase family protein [Candidatus Bathyarchaeota archaeon]|nr:2'-5' RNA ligase family protein [Candidatus Bathyarchaeota archaeon]